MVARFFPRFPPMFPRLRTLLLTCLAASTCANAAELEAGTRAYFREHCFRCHGEKKQKGELRLDTLDTDLTSAATYDRWREILVRMKAGEMPPEEEPQPKPAELATVSKFLTGQLAAAADQHRTEGRVVLRRLNRVEYENTVHDLFGVQVAVKEMLPEDTVAQGFDNIGAALNISPVLMERYLDAAEAVLAAAVAPLPKPVESKKERYNLYDSLPSWFLPGTYPQDEGVVLFRCEGSASQLGKYRAPGPGQYRVRIAASAFQSEQPLAMSVLFGNFNAAAGSARHMGYFNAPPGAPAVVEVEGRFEKFDTVKVHPVSLPFV
jgi:mono/diheme cytochrome c family protein